MDKMSDVDYFSSDYEHCLMKSCLGRRAKLCFVSNVRVNALKGDLRKNSPRVRDWFDSWKPR